MASALRVGIKSRQASGAAGGAEVTYKVYSIKGNRFPAP